MILGIHGNKRKQDNHRNLRAIDRSWKISAQVESGAILGSIANVAPRQPNQTGWVIGERLLIPRERAELHLSHSKGRKKSLAHPNQLYQRNDPISSRMKAVVGSGSGKPSGRATGASSMCGA